MPQRGFLGNGIVSICRETVILGSVSLFVPLVDVVSVFFSANFFFLFFIFFMNNFAFEAGLENKRVKVSEESEKLLMTDNSDLQQQQQISSSAAPVAGQTSTKIDESLYSRQL